jgi:hypothetical protein
MVSRFEMVPSKSTTKSMLFFHEMMPLSYRSRLTRN